MTGDLELALSPPYDDEGEQQFYSEDQPRDENGRWVDAGGGGSVRVDVAGALDREDAAAFLLDATIGDGGFTYQPIDHSFPHEGYAVSLFPEREVIETPGSLNVARIAAYMKANEDLLKDPANHVGGWLDKESGKVFLDISRIVESSGEAKKLGIKFKQKAFYDLKRHETVKIAEVRRVIHSAAIEAVREIRLQAGDDAGADRGGPEEIDGRAREEVGEAFYSDAQPRRVDIGLPGGQWVSIDAGSATAEAEKNDPYSQAPYPTIAFHGTTAENLAKIKREGITVQRDKTWGPGMYHGERGESVFVTTDPLSASRFAYLRLVHLRGKAEAAGVWKGGAVPRPVVLSLVIPKEEWAKFHRDFEADHDKLPGGAYGKVTIKPEWIAKAYSVKWTPEKSWIPKLTPLKFAAAGMVEAWAVIFVEDDLADAEKFYRQDQERDENGRWVDEGGGGGGGREEIARKEGNAPLSGMVVNPDESSDTGARAWAGDEPPKGFVRVYRGVNPNRDPDDPTHGLWYTTSYDDAVSYANWTYEGTGELGPNRAVLALDLPIKEALDYAREGSRHYVRAEDFEKLHENPHALEGHDAYEMLVSRAAAQVAKLYEGDPKMAQFAAVKTKAAPPYAAAERLDLSDDLYDAYVSAYGDALISHAQARGALEPVSLVPIRAKEYADARAAELVTNIDETTRNRMAEIIAQSAGEGDPDSVLADKIEESFLFTPERAELIARTEAATAYNVGTVHALRDAGEQYVYVSDGDQWDEACINADGEYWTLEEAEANPLEHPNCQRMFRPLTGEELAEVEAEEAGDSAVRLSTQNAGTDASGADISRQAFEYDEAEHPRDDKGLWVEKGSEGGDEHKLVRDRGGWAESHRTSQAITGAAAALMGVKGYEPPDASEARTADARAVRFLTAIHDDRVGSDEPLYHVFDNKSGAAFEIGDTVTLPLAAAAGDIVFPSWYEGLSYDENGKVFGDVEQENRMTVFEFPRGTPMAGYERYIEGQSDVNAKWKEALVSGRFQVTGVSRLKGEPANADTRYLTGENMNWRVVSVRPIETFNPKTGRWRPTRTRLLKFSAQAFYSEDQPRDENNQKWVDAGGTGDAPAPMTREQHRLLLRKAEAEWVKEKDYTINDENAAMHRPAGPDGGSPLYDLGREGTYPEDVYSYEGLRYYGSGGIGDEHRMDVQMWGLIHKYEARPNAPVTIYRAVGPDDEHGIMPGSWVTPVRAYAKQHGESTLQGKYKIVSKTVYARDLFTDGNSWLEWGYHPQEPKLSIRDLRRKYAGEFSAKFWSEDQPRVPAGNGEESGRWTSDGEGGGGGNAAPAREQVKINGKVIENLYTEGDNIVLMDDPTDPEDVRTYSKEEWVNDWNTDPSDYFPDYEDNFNKDFWESPGYLYHATTEEHAEEIEKEGLVPMNETRGLSNRGVGGAVFTTDDPETTAMGVYGDIVFRIDTAAMKADGITPYVGQEPDVIEHELRGALAWAIGLRDYSGDIEQGMDPTTVIVHGKIPPKYLKRFDRRHDTYSAMRFYREDQERDERGRWVDEGGGAEGAAGRQPSLERVGMVGVEQYDLSPAAFAERQRIASDVAKELNYPIEGIRISDDMGERHAVGNGVMREAGYYEPTTGQIVLLANSYPAEQPHAEDLFRQTVAHEINHAKFDAITKLYTEEQQAHFHDPDAFMNATPAERAAAGPISAIIDSSLNNMDALARSDGVTPYSAGYWNAVYQGPIAALVHNVDPDEQLRAAVRETLAEISGILYATPKGAKNLPLDKTRAARRARLMKELRPEWRRLYRAVVKAYPLTKGKLFFDRRLPGMENLK